MSKIRFFLISVSLIIISIALSWLVKSIKINPEKTTNNKSSFETETKIKIDSLVSQSKKYIYSIDSLKTCNKKLDSINRQLSKYYNAKYQSQYQKVIHLSHSGIDSSFNWTLPKK